MISTPKTTASIPPLPLLSMESSGELSFHQPIVCAITLMPSSPVIMPSIPPRIGVPPNRSAARYPVHAVRYVKKEVLISPSIEHTTLRKRLSAQPGFSC